MIMVTMFGHVRAVCNPKYRPVAHCQPVLHAFAPEASSDHHSCLKMFDTPAGGSLRSTQHKWEFPKIRGTVFWGPYNKDPGSYYLGYYIRVPYFRKLQKP